MLAVQVLLLMCAERLDCQHSHEQPRLTDALNIPIGRLKFEMAVSMQSGGDCGSQFGSSAGKGGTT